MSLFDQLGGQHQPTMNPIQMLSQLRSDPAGMIRQLGMTIPSGMTDPRQIINHLLSSGQVVPARYQSALQALQGMMGRR
jgi:hypothetical protein